MGDEVTLILPAISLLTGPKAVEPSISVLHISFVPNAISQEVLPNSARRDSAASRNSVVSIALSPALSTGTSTNDLLKVSRKVPPGG